MNEWINKIICGDALEVLQKMPSEIIDCVITSPPYWGLRDYGNDNQIGLEKTPEKYVAKIVSVFREVKRVLKKEGTVWLNLGDSYASRGKEGGDIDKDNGMDIERGRGRLNKHKVIKPKDIVGIPWRVAFALQADGWYLRQDIIWAKPNPMPESVTDRCTKSHEYIFLLSKNPKYYFDNEAIKEAANYDGRKDTIMKGSKKYKDHIMPNGNPQTIASGGHERWNKNEEGNYVRNRRSVWTINTKPFKDAHFATFPEDLIVPMVKAGSPERGLILDPFMGSGTTALVAKQLSRNYVGIELSSAYCKMAEDRLRQEVLF